MELDDCVVNEHDIDIGQMENGGMNFICYISINYCNFDENFFFDIGLVIIWIKLYFVVIYRSNEWRLL